MASFSVQLSLIDVSYDLFFSKLSVNHCHASSIELLASQVVWCDIVFASTTFIAACTIIWCSEVDIGSVEVIIFQSRKNVIDSNA